MTEALINTAAGFILSMLLQLFVVPMITGHRTSFTADFMVVLVFTVASIVRSYGLRRLFNTFTERAA